VDTFCQFELKLRFFLVPYDEVSQESALVEMFGQVGAQKCQYVVAVGALAGLTVSMFGEY
jgi:cationic amino acid transporter 14